MPLRIFRSRNVSGANVVQMLMVAGMFGMFFLGALYLQRVLGYDALEIGLAFLPVAVLIGALSLGFSARLDHALRRADDADSRASSLIVAGLLLFTQAPVDGSYVADVLPVMVLLGMGAGLSLPGDDDARDVGRDGAATRASRPGLVNTSMQVGGAIGLAVLATLATSRTDSLLDGGASNAAALTGGYHLAFGVAAGLVAAAIAIAVTVLEPVRVTAREVAARARGAGAGAGVLRGRLGGPSCGCNERRGPRRAPFRFKSLFRI